MTHQTITLGGGCFWCLDAVFAQVRGVLQVQAGYSNGQASQPSYEQVCTGQTGHAETVRVEYDPQETNPYELLKIFWEAHDPTTLDRQGNDVGSQYRSAVFITNDTQLNEALRTREEYQELFDDDSRHFDI